MNPDEEFKTPATSSAVMHSASGRWRLGLALAAGTSLLWGVAPIALKVVLEVMDPYTVAWWRFVISGGVMLAWVAAQPGRLGKMACSGPAAALAAATVAGLAANYALFQAGLVRVTPSAAAVTVQLAPVFFLAGAVILFKEPYRWSQAAGFAVLLVGLVLFFNQRLGEVVARLSDYGVGLLLIVGAAGAWAVYALAQKQLLTRLSSEAIMLLVFFGGTVLFFPVSRPGAVLELNGVQLGMLLFSGVNTVAAYAMFNGALHHLPASRISSVFAVIPLITIGSVKLLEQAVPGFVSAEPLNLISLGGAALVAGGSMVSSLAAIGVRPGRGPGAAGMCGG